MEIKELELIIRNLTAAKGSLDDLRSFRQVIAKENIDILETAKELELIIRFLADFLG